MAHNYYSRHERFVLSRSRSPPKTNVDPREFSGFHPLSRRGSFSETSNTTGTTGLSWSGERDLTSDHRAIPPPSRTSRSASPLLARTTYPIPGRRGPAPAPQKIMSSFGSFPPAGGAGGSSSLPLRGPLGTSNHPAQQTRSNHAPGDSAPHHGSASTAGARSVGPSNAAGGALPPGGSSHQSGSSHHSVLETGESKRLLKNCGGDIDGIVDCLEDLLQRHEYPGPALPALQRYAISQIITKNRNNPEAYDTNERLAVLLFSCHDNHLRAGQVDEANMCMKTAAKYKLTPHLPLMHLRKVQW